MKQAAAGGHMKVLQYMKDNGCPIDNTACDAAARKGNLQLLKWLRENGFPWDSDTTKEAAMKKLLK